MPCDASQAARVIELYHSPYRTYAVARISSGFCLRQHGTFHPLYAVFPRGARKNRILTEIKYRSAEGKKSRPRKSCYLKGIASSSLSIGRSVSRPLSFARVAFCCPETHLVLVSRS